MIISHTKKIIFIHVHRTAGTSLSNVLRRHSHENVEIFSQHSNAKTLGEDFFIDYNDYYKFGFTRNPWERIFSWYSLIQKNNRVSLAEDRVRFEEFLELDSASDFSSNFFHYNSLDYFTCDNDENIANDIFRYENINDEVRRLSNKIDMQLVDVLHVNAASPPKYKDFYTGRSRDLVAQKCKKDIEYFNYTF